MKRFVIQKYTEFLNGTDGTWLKAYNFDSSSDCVLFEETAIDDDGNEIVVNGARFMNKSEIEELLYETYGKECQVIIDFD